jgi:hypothetical protein
LIGGSGFVERLLREVDAYERRRDELKKSWESFVTAVAKAQGVNKEQLFEKGRRQAVSDGKAVLIDAGTAHFGRTNKELVKLTCMAEPSASRAKQRGRELLKRMGIFNT